MDIQKTINELIEAGLTQTHIATSLGCSQPMVSDMSKGLAGVKNPSSRTVEGLKKLTRKHLRGKGEADSDLFGSVTGGLP